MKEHLYSLIKNNRVLVSLSSIDTAREGIVYFGGNTHIKYNQPGIDSYEKAKLWEAEHNENH